MKEREGGRENERKRECVCVREREQEREQVRERQRALAQPPNFFSWAQEFEVHKFQAVC